MKAGGDGPQGPLIDIVIRIAPVPFLDHRPHAPPGMLQMLQTRSPY